MLAMVSDASLSDTTFIHGAICQMYLVLKFIYAVLRIAVWEITANQAWKYFQKKGCLESRVEKTWY